MEGSTLVVQNRPEWFAGATEAISEVGGYSIPVATVARICSRWARRR